MQQHFFKHFQSPGLTGFIEDVCITLIDKTEDYWRQKLWLRIALTSRKVFTCSSYIWCLLQIFFNIFDAGPLVLGLRF